MDQRTPRRHAKTLAQAPADGSLRLEDFLPYRLNIVTQAVSQALSNIYSREFGISVPEWRILAALGENREVNGPDWPGMTARDLAHHGRMGKVMVSRAATSLIKRKLLARRANRTDRRESFLTMTKKGAGIYALIVPRAQAFQTRLKEGISPADSQAFDRVIQHLLLQADAAGATILENRTTEP